MLISAVLITIRMLFDRTVSTYFPGGILIPSNRSDGSLTIQNGRSIDSPGSIIGGGEVPQNPGQMSYF